jgi:hypothetical protein
LDITKLSNRESDEYTEKLEGMIKLNNAKNKTQQMGNFDNPQEGFRFTKKLLFDAYVNKENKSIVGLESGFGSLGNYSSLLDMYAISELYQIPIEVYMCSINIDRSDNFNIEGVNYVKGTFKNARSDVLNDEFTLNQLEFVTLINGHFEKAVCRIALQDGLAYGLIIDIDDTKTNEITKFVKNDEIFNYNFKDVDTLIKYDVSQSAFLDIIDERFFKQILSITFAEDNLRISPQTKEGLSAAIFLYTIDTPKLIFNYFLLNKQTIADIFFGKEFYKLASHINISDLYQNSFYKNFLLEDVYIYSFLNFFYDAKTNRLKKPTTNFGDEYLEISFYISMLFFLKKLKPTIFINTLSTDFNDDSNLFNDRKWFALDFLENYKKRSLKGRLMTQFATIKKDIDTLLKAQHLELVDGNTYKSQTSYLRLFKSMQNTVETEVQTIDFFTKKNDVMNSIFIQKFLNSYGYDSTFKILSNLMPDLFNYKQDEETLKKYLKTAETDFNFNWNHVWSLLSSRFLSKFKTTSDMLNYVLFFFNFRIPFQNTIKTF